jgi:hypothetical protein
MYHKRCHLIYVLPGRQAKLKLDMVEEVKGRSILAKLKCSRRYDISSGLIVHWKKRYE